MYFLILLINRNIKIKKKIILFYGLIYILSYIILNLKDLRDLH